jgi:hypothetical protein
MSTRRNDSQHDENTTVKAEANPNGVDLQQREDSYPPYSVFVMH